MAVEEKNRSFFEKNKYENFRNFMKVNFYYCSLSPEQQSEYIDSIGTTKYNWYKNIVEKTTEGKVTFPKYNKRKTFKYDVTQFESNYNALANSFQLRTITALETSLTIFILCSLANKKMTAIEITDLFNDEVNEKTIMSRIKNMCEYGLISTDGKRYYIDENRLYSMDDALLLKLLNMSDFMKNLIVPEVSGYNIYNLLKRVYEERTKTEYYSPFQFKYSHLANILDDNILWSLLEAIDKRQMITFKYNKKKKGNLIPVKLFTENEYNRRYLFAVTCEPFRFYIFKLSEIYNLQTVGKKAAVTEEEFAKFIEVYEAEKQYSFSGKMDSGSKTVSIILKYKNSRKLKSQIKSDFKCVKFEKDNTAIVTIKNKRMIKPYLRANMGLIETTDVELSDMLKSEIEEMKKNYGIIP